MQKVIFLGTDLHGDQSELAAKLVKDLKNALDSKKGNYKIVSIQNRKDFCRQHRTLIIRRLTKIALIRKIFQAILLPVILLFLRIRYNSIFSFWTADQKYHSYLFSFLRKIGYKINFTVISGYDKKYDSISQCDRIICQSPKMLSHLSQKIPPEKLRLILPWADTTIFKPGKKEYDILIPSVPYKIEDFKERGMDKIIALLQKGRFKSKVIFRSEEAYDYFKKLKVTNTELINKILDERQLAMIMSKAKVIPLLYEKGCPDMPLSAIEGMACGCSIITTKETGLGDIVVENKCGMAYKSGEDLSKKMEKILSRKDYQKNAYFFAKKNFDKKRNIAEYLELMK